MEADDEAINAIREQDQQWIASHCTELWPEAQKGYAEEGRGALLVVVCRGQLGDSEVVAGPHAYLVQHLTLAA